MESVLIIGSGQAGIALASEIRKLDPRRPITLLGRDTHSFNRTEFVQALGPQQTPLTIKPLTELAERLRIEVVSGHTVQSIKPIDGSVVTDQGEFQADKLVLATGASPMLPTFSRELPGLVAAVTHAAVINKLRTRLASINDLIIIGAGQSGCELANTLADAGKNVTVVEQHAGPLFELMPLDARRHLVEQLEERGVKFQFNARCASASKEGHRARLGLTNGKTVEGDLVIACIGVVPNTKLASDAGLKVRKGIVVDRRMSTSAVNTYALGDCAEVNGVWLPYSQPIRHQVAALARTLCGTPTQVNFPPMPLALNIPCCPTVIAQPRPGLPGQWETLMVERGLNASFIDDNGQLQGFVLMGDETGEAPFLQDEIPNWLNL